MTQQLVIFEGISGSGKTTLFTPVHRARQYEDIQVHRFMASHWVYAQSRGEEVDEDTLWAMEGGLAAALPVLTVWCRCSPEVACQRKVEQGDTNVEPLGMMRRLDDLYREYFATHVGRLLILDTEALSIDECVASIVEDLRKHDR